MNVYEVKTVRELISGNPYVGRGIVAGKSGNGKAVAAYFIMGRSNNSRNRVFTEKDGAIFTEPFDASKVEDPSLIIYAAVRRFKDKLIVTNGDQTDTVFDALKDGKCFAAALKTRTFEPDAPNFTPRISAILDLADPFSYRMSILKSADGKGPACNRFTFDYEPIDGVGHFLHTYVTDGNPLPSFVGEPERVHIPESIDEFASELWDSLDADNKISLFVRYIDLATGREETKIINKNK